MPRAGLHPAYGGSPQARAYRGTVTARTTADGTTDNTIATVTIPAGAAGTGDIVRFTCWGNLVSGNVSPTWTFRTKVGGSTITTTSTTIGANGSPRRIRVTVELDLSAPAVWELVTVIDSTAAAATPSTAAQMAGASLPAGLAHGNGTTDFTDAVTLALSLQWNTADATFVMTPAACHAEVIKAG